MKRMFSALLVSLAVSVCSEASDQYYLFAYFSDDTTEGQQVKYAVSADGLNFKPLNGGRPVIAADSVSVSGGVRDPHILKCDDGIYRMTLTDMDISKGKWTSRGIVMLTSSDLIHWSHSTVHFPERYAGKDPSSANAVWAPQTIYDPSEGKYMVYFSLHSEKDGPYPVDKVFFAYANEDFTDLATDPMPLFDFDGPSIDTDIVQDEKGQYHLFFNTWGSGGTMRRQYIFTDLHDSGNWQLHPGHCQPNKMNSEGSTAYPLHTGGWILCYDCFRDRKFQFCKTSDFQTFELVRTTDTSDAFNPKHGSVVRISGSEYESLAQHDWDK